MNIFVIGDQDTVFGLNLVGIEGAAVQDVEQAQAALEDVLAQSEQEILLITRPLAAQMQSRLNRLKMTTLNPVVVEIPGSEPEQEASSLRDLIEETVGMSLGGSMKGE